MKKEKWGGGEQKGEGKTIKVGEKRGDNRPKFYFSSKNWAFL